MNAPIYTHEGKEKGTIALPEHVFNVPWNADLVHQVAMSMMSNARANTAHAKDRGDVRGGGKKPWKQKGTGRARHGSSRSPIWRGGGITHGPTNERDYNRKINKKVRAKALAVVLSQKLRDGQILFVEAFSFKAPKTKEAQAIITALAKGAKAPTLATKPKNAGIIALSAKTKTSEKSFTNLPSFSVEEVRNLNPVTLLSSAYLVIENPEESVKILGARFE